MVSEAVATGAAAVVADPAPSSLLLLLLWLPDLLQPRRVRSSRSEALDAIREVIYKKTRVYNHAVTDNSMLFYTLFPEEDDVMSVAAGAGADTG